MSDVDVLLKNKRASVVAPAGCGKTELIARSVAREQGRALVLTHTHAGVNALRSRLARHGIGRDRARVETIAGWCLRFSSAFPVRSGVSNTQPTGAEWNLVYDGAAAVLRARALRRVVEASYSSLYVDEYQDCCEEQHRVVTCLANVLPCRVFGDPLQGIFAFAGRTLLWSDVEREFPHALQLRTPWRWKDKNEALGTWLLDTRDRLCAGAEVDFRDCPVRWRELSHQNQGAEAFRMLRATGSAVVIKKWAPDSHRFARATKGRYRSMEEMDCKDLLTAAGDFDSLIGSARAARLYQFADACMSGLSTALPGVKEALDAGQQLVVARRRKNVPVVQTLMRVTTTNDVSVLAEAMRNIERIEGVTLFRQELWGELRRTLAEFARGSHPSLRDAAWAVRNRLRVLGRRLDPRLVSRTVLIKGLEFDHALVPDAEEFRDARRPGDGAKNLYVALTRASLSLAVLSRAPVVRYPAPQL